MNLHISGPLLTILLAPLETREAYLDPGSGSILLQLLVASLLGLAVLLRTSWGRIKSFFRRGSLPEGEEENDEQQTSD